MIKFVSTVLLVSAALMAAPSAHAQPLNRDGSFAASIRQGDLNLATAQGQATFRGRVKTVANQICGIPQTLPYADALSVEQCRTQVVRAADARIAALAPATEFAGTR
jgi:UrcA family protein